MFAISFDLVVAETEMRHPKGTTAAYDEIARTLKRYDFDRIKAASMRRMLKTWPIFFKL